MKKASIILSIMLVLAMSCKKEEVEPVEPTPMVTPTTDPADTTGASGTNSDGITQWKFVVYTNISSIELDSVIFRKHDLNNNGNVLDSMVVMKSEIPHLSNGGNITFNALQVTTPNPMEVQSGDHIRVYLYLNTTTSYSGNTSMRYELGFNTDPQTASTMMAWSIDQTTGYGVIIGGDNY